MAIFTLQEVLAATKGHCVNPETTTEFTSVSTDTRLIEAHSLFVALQGEKFDGHDFLNVAVKNGAVGAIVAKGKAIDGLICVEVEDTLKAYQQLANFHRRRFDIPVIAITGSSGKTTTKEMVATILESKFNVLKTEKNFNNEIGLPLTLLSLTSEHEACVVEMGMRGLGQIKELAEIAEPTIGIITNVGTSHIELLGSQEAIAKAKGELVKAINEDGFVILNEDDAYVKAMTNLTTGKVIGYGIENPATIAGYQLRYKKDGIKFTCKSFDEVFDVFLPMIGTHNVYNALAAIAVGRALGIPSAKIKKALGNFKGIPMRQEIVPLKDIVILNDSYNANPSSMAETIKALGQLEGKRKIAMVGDMLELGEFAEQGHKNIGQLLGEEHYDIVYTLGKYGAIIGKNASLAGVAEVVSLSNHDEVVTHYMAQYKKGDVVLVKASRGMKMEIIVEKLRERMKE